MLKKAGIVVAVAAAGVLAVAPLAFAGEVSHHHGDHSTTVKNSPSCSFANASDSRSRQGASGVSSPLLGVLGTATNAAAPVTTQTNAPVGSCNNFSDLVDANSNNKTKTITNSKTVDNSKRINQTRSVTDVFSAVFGG